MENRFMPKNSEWSSRSGVLLNMVNSCQPQSNTYPEDVEIQYQSPKGGHSKMARRNYPVNPEPGDSSAYSVVNGNPLLGANLPSHMFMHAVNFETLRDDDITEKEKESESYTDQGSTIHNGSLNLSDAQADLMEQQQAIEQAKLLKRFKELREWQLQQQQLLMLQQQSQLMALKSEQNRVQEMISKQRQSQWGGKVTMAPDPSPFISPRKRTVKPAGIAQALAGGVVNRYQQVHGVTERGDHEVHQFQAQRGLPKPHIPDTDSEGGCNTNPELYSNPGSIDSHDSAELHPLQVLPADDDDDSDYSLGEPVHMYNDPGHLRNGTTYNPQLHVEPAQVYHSQLQGDQGHQETAPMPRSQRSPREITVNRLAKSEGYELEADEGTGSQSFYSSPVAAQPERPPPEYSPGIGHEARHGEDSSLRGDDDHHEEASFSNQDLDDRPVASAVGGKKTFEELLEEQLRAEEKKSQKSPRSPEKPVKRPFLRRGQGLERFKGPPQKKKTPVPAKSSTTNKKTEVPKRTVTTAKASVASGSKGQKNNSSNKPASAKADTKKEDLNEGSFKKPGLAPKTIQELPGLPQKSLKLKPLAQKSSVSCDKKLDLTKKQAVTSEDQTDLGSKPGKSTGSEMKRGEISSQSQPTQQNGKYSKVDASFLSHLEKMQENSEVEEEDLEEFEMLEHFADNASFSSNSSLVVKVLQKDRWKAAQLQGSVLPAHQAPLYYMEDHRRFFAPPQAGHGQTAETTAKNVEDNSPDVVLLDSSDSDSSSSDSSDTETEDNDLLSTIKQRDLVSEGMNLSSQANVEKCDAGLQMENVPDVHQKNTESEFYWNSKNESDSELSDKEYSYDRLSEKSEVTKSPVKRKIAGRDYSSARLAKSAINSASMTEDIPGYKLSKENIMNSHDSDEVLSRSPEEEVEKSQPSKSQSVDRNANNPGESTGNSKEEDSGKDEAKKLCEDEFDDGEEWGEQSLKDAKHDGLSSSEESEGNDTLIEDQGAGRQTKANSGSSPKRSGATDLSSPGKPSPPPTSKLITKLFPKLRPQKPSPKQQEQQEKLQAAREAPMNDGIQSKVLRDKLAELETEINKFRAENANLERLRKEREEGLSKLKKEIEDFEKEKNEELQRLNEFKTQEMKKLKHEKKVFEKYQKAARAVPDKKEREEIETLRSQLSDLQEELKRKESRWSSNTSRLKSRLEEVEQENSELKEEIKLLEKKRLEWLQKEQANKATERFFSQASAPPSRSTPALGSASNSVTNGFGFINTDSEEEVDPVRDEKKKVSRNPPSHISKTDGKKPGQVTNQKPDRPNSANHQRPKSGKPVSTNHKSDKLNSPSKSTSHKRSHSERPGNNMRTSLTEDVPRRQITAEALPQLVSEVPSVSEFEHRVPPHSRKMAARFDIDKSSIDKGVDYEEIQHPDGKLERIFNTGAREILFSNGTRKEISSDGQSIIVSFFNGDVKQIMADQRVVYYYSEAQTTHSTYPDGLEILQFPNNQVEKHYPDGTKEITFPDQTVKYLFPSGVEESVFTDGTVIRVEKSGDKTIEFPNGQREIHTQQFKKREYPDGTVKTVFPDGRQETRYSNGRIRVKDKEGNVVMDKRS
ncbi:centromere protein J-like isoform X2 [Liolophura sinensis]|uniref:centromere protein J-like isoform X2 n=1 Tax=Liolophura sinensis TaxID=3198878 RepID=UPI00315985F4